jgi:nicotinamide phosphoribosyltransferase
MNNNIILLTDSYKFGGHWNMLPPKTEGVYSYFEARKGAKWDEVTFFGLQYVMKRYLSGVVVTQAKIEQAARYAKAHFGNDKAFNREGWEYILNEFGGVLPIIIKAAPEGSVIPISNVLMTIENLGGEKTAWLTSYLETVLTPYMWYGSTVATQSREAKKLVKHYIDRTSDNALIDFFVHDFGCRSTTCMEQAAFGGAAHAISFKGSDTVNAIEFAEEMYNADIQSLLFSVPASEHAIACSEGRDGESNIVGRLLEKYPTGILSLVADSYDVYNFAEKICGETFKDVILNRDGVLVIRPDSGEPEEVMSKLVNILWNKFGGTINSKGYRVINPKVRLLWGDGINIHGVQNILGNFMANGWAAENIACFGMGSNLLQKLNRDDLRFAFKSSAQKRDGVWYDVYKDPIEGGKTSKRGRLKLVKTSDGFTTVRENEEGEDYLQTVFEMGKLVKEYNFEEIRERAKL